MSKGKNCPNCGAPYDPLEPKCPYCGTIYYDMSAVDFDNGEPIYLQIKSHNILITQKVIPELGSIEMSSDVVLCDGVHFITGTTVTTDISFRAIADTDGTMMKVMAYES